MTWKNLTYASLKHGSVMTFLKLNVPFMDTDVLDGRETDMVEDLLCLYPESNITMVGPNGLEFLLAKCKQLRYIHWGVVPSTC